MKYKDFSPQDNVFWYLKRKALQPLRQSIQADVVVVGGGMAGLSAAQSFHEKGKSVVLLEQYYCGGGASGKSSGFITPNSELGLHNLVRELGPMAAKKLWEFVKSGVSHIEDNIKKFNMVCDDEILDTCIVANSKKKFKEIEIEHEAFKKFAYDSHLYQQAGVRGIIGSDTYFGAQVYDSTFGIDAYLYCQGMKDILQKQGVQIYEETPVINVGQSGVETTHAQVRADHIVICVDRFLPQFETSLGKKVSHVPTFIMVSEPLTDHDIKKIFPQKNMLVWDTDMIYQYFRIIQNQRFLIGGSDIFATAWGSEQHDNKRVERKLIKYVREKFPQVNMTFEYFWPGLIGVTQDLRPLAGFDENMKNVYYISAATGLPWAAALGRYSAERIVDKRDDLDIYFSPQRKFLFGNILQTILGKRITFPLANLYTLMK